MSVLENIGKDYHSVPQDEASATLATVTQAIKRAIASGERTKRTIGQLLNAVVASDILIAAGNEAGKDRSWSADARTTALSDYIKSVNTSKDDASAWRKYADGEQARENVGISKPAAVSAYRDIAAGTSVDDIAAMLKDTFVSPTLADGEKAPAMSRKTVAAGAASAGIGTPDAGNDTGGNAPVADSELQTTPAQERTAAVNTIKALHADGVMLSLTEVKILQAVIKEVTTLKAVA